MPPKKKTVDFEQSLKALEELVNRMEQGDMSLEESLEAFQKGISLTRECQTRLAEAEQQVNLLIEENDQFRLEAFEPDQDDD
jgi:exodeoxyribonuclease VII small subunit